MKIFVQKGCKVFSVYVIGDKGNDNKLKIEYIPILKDFKDIFSEVVLVLPTKRDIEFKIYLILGTIPISKYSYIMNIIEIIELKS